MAWNYLVLCGRQEQWQPAETLEEARQLALDNANLMYDSSPIQIRAYHIVEQVVITYETMTGQSGVETGIEP